MSVSEAIEQADAVLRTATQVDDGLDPRWQALIALAGHIEDSPIAVWEFARQWGKSEDEDLRAAIATLLLEHLLEYHFEALFAAVEVEVATSIPFADCFSRTWPLGQTDWPGNRERFDMLKERAGAV